MIFFVLEKFFIKLIIMWVMVYIIESRMRFFRNLDIVNLERSFLCLFDLVKFYCIYMELIFNNNNKKKKVGIIWLNF